MRKKAPMRDEVLAWIVSALLVVCLLLAIREANACPTDAELRELEQASEESARKAGGGK